MRPWPGEEWVGGERGAMHEKIMGSSSKLYQPKHTDGEHSQVFVGTVLQTLSRRAFANTFMTDSGCVLVCFKAVTEIRRHQGCLIQIEHAFEQFSLNLMHAHSEKCPARTHTIRG